MDKAFKTTEYQLKLIYKGIFQNTSKYLLELAEDFTFLPFETDVTRTGSTPIPIGNYKYRHLGLHFVSNKRSKLFYDIGANHGTFYNGNKTSLSGELSYRKQPWGIFSLNITHDKVSMPTPYENASLTLLGPKIELSFTKSVFFTTFIQYNTQLENVNINSRFQWRFKPMSDLYVVYTDNYYSPDMTIKNKALVLKLIYWFSL
jgi:hypothetical protein